MLLRGQWAGRRPNIFQLPLASRFICFCRPTCKLLRLRRASGYIRPLKLSMSIFHLLLVGALGWLLGGRLGAGNTLQDNSFYPIQSQPDWPHLTSIREGFWFDILARNPNDHFSFQPDSHHEMCSLMPT